MLLTCQQDVVSGLYPRAHKYVASTVLVAPPPTPDATHVRCTPGRQELLGHCVELYHSNRDGMTALVAHLERYGYQQPVSARREPDDPCSTALAAASAYGADELCFADGEGSSGFSVETSMEML
jgi:hypothetical protein